MSLKKETLWEKEKRERRIEAQARRRAEKEEARIAEIRANQRRLRDESYERDHKPREVVRDLGGGVRVIQRGCGGGYTGRAVIR